MSSRASATIRALAAEIRSLKSRPDSLAERSESAGRLFIDALDASAFGTEKFAGFRAMVRQRQEQQSDCTPAWKFELDGRQYEAPAQRTNGWISAWSEAVWWLRGKPDDRIGVGVGDEKLFAEDCEYVAQQLEADASREQTGPPNGFLSKEVRAMTQLSATALHKYANEAGVSTPKKGGKNYRYPAEDVRKILRRIIEKSDDQKVIKKCNDSLEVLTDITS